MRRSKFLLWVPLAVSLASAADLRTGYYAGREVTFENIDGLAVFQGDIILGTTEDLERAAANRPAKTGHESTTVAESRRLWLNGVVPYVIDTALSSNQQQTVRSAIAHWNTRTPIRLTERAGEGNYVRFTTSSSTIACSSSVGMIGGQQLIRLPEGCSLGATIHEIGHAVGLWHEQSRNDRNRHMTVLYENIDKASGLQFDQTFDDGRDAGPYDFGSIMHYGPFDFSKDGLAPALESVPAGIPIGQRAGLSAGDIDAIYRLYGQTPRRTTIATTPSGLEVRVDGVLVRDGTSFDWTPGTVHTIDAPFQGDTQTRYLFASWSDGGPSAHAITASPDRTVYIANFVRQHRIDVALNTPGSGTVTLDPPSPDGFYTERSSVYIAAAPAPGYYFLEWSVRPSRSLNPKSFVVRSPTTLLTSFTRIPVTTITSNPIGRIVRVDGTQYSTPTNFAWTSGERHTVQIDPPDDDFLRFRFTGWSDGGPETRTITSTGREATFTANYITQYPLTMRTVGGRTSAVQAVPGSIGGFYDEGAIVQLTATPPVGTVLLGWTGDARGGGNPVTIKMDDQKLVTAEFGFRAPAFFITGSATGDQAGVSPGQLISLYGTNIGPSNPSGLQVAGGRVTTSLAGLDVLFDGVPAPITYASANQVNVVAPYATRSRSITSISIRKGGQIIGPVSMLVVDSTPGIFTVDGSGRGPGAILNANGSVNSPSNPAPRGGIIVIYATGEGVNDPIVPDGQVANAIYPKPLLPISVRIGGQPAVVHYAGAAPGFVAGAMQINVQIPPGIEGGPRTPVSLVIGDQASPSGVTVAVR